MTQEECGFGRRNDRHTRSADYFVCTFLEIGLGFSNAPGGCGAVKETSIPMRDLSAWRRALPVALILALLVVTEAGLIAQSLGTAPQPTVAFKAPPAAHP